MAFTLTLWTNSAQRMRWADAAGVDRIGLDLERLGKADRQAGLATWLSPHRVEDLAVLRKQVRRAELFVRTNPLNPASAEEVDGLVAAGVSVLMLPNFSSVKEVAAYLEIVAGRAKVVPLVERLGALEAIEGFRSLGLEEFHVGLNDLSIELGLEQRLGVLVAPTMDRIAAIAADQDLKLCVGGLGRAGDSSLPIASDLVYAQQARLGSRGALLARAFFNRPMEQADFGEEIRRLRLRLSEWLGASNEALLQARDDLARALEGLRPVRSLGP